MTCLITLKYVTGRTLLEVSCDYPPLYPRFLLITSALYLFPTCAVFSTSWSVNSCLIILLLFFPLFPFLCCLFISPLLTHSLLSLFTSSLFVSLLLLMIRLYTCMLQALFPRKMHNSLFQLTN